MDIIKLVKKIEPLIALAVLITLFVLSVLLYNDNELKKEIGENCGYESKWDGFCYCDKQTISNKKIELENIQKGGDYLDVPLGR